MAERGQPQPVRHNVQPVPSQFRQKALGNGQSVQIHWFEVQAASAAGGLNKTHVKTRVVGHQRPVPRKSEKGLHCLPLPGGVKNIPVRNARKLYYLFGQGHAGVDESLKPVCYLPAPENHRAYLRYAVPVGVKACCLNIESHEFIRQAPVTLSVDGQLIIHIVDKIALQAENDLDAVFLGGVPCFREGMGYSVVCNCHSRMPPLGRPLYDLLGVTESVQRRITGVKV